MQVYQKEAVTGNYQIEGGIINDENALAGVQQYTIKCEVSVQQCM